MNTTDTIHNRLVEIGEIVSATHCLDNPEELRRALGAIREIAADGEAEKPEGEYRTPKAALDFVMANPPLDIPPADLPAERSVASLHADLPMLGIEFRQFSTKTFYKFVALFKGEKPNDSHVYEVTVRPMPCASGVRWHANCTTDGGTVLTLESRSKHTAIKCALAAMRAHLVRSHRAAWRTWRKLEKQQARNGKAAEPLSPEAELAETVERQKEVEA